MKRLISSVCILGLFSILAGCGPKEPDITRYGLPDAAISRDFEVLPQELAAYAQKAGEKTKLLEREEQAEQDDRFDANFFAAWNGDITHLPKEAAFEGVMTLAPGKGYAENLRPWNLERWQTVISNCLMETYGSAPVKAAITVDTVHLRRLPTNSPYFLDPGLAGEGFPFDYLQNSTLWIGTPVSVMHTSFDRRWVLVQTRLVSGWVEADKIAAVDKKFIAAWKARPLGAIVHDNATIFVNPHKEDAVSGTFVREAHIGTVLPFAESTRETPPQKAPVVYLTVPVRDLNGKAVMVPALIPMQVVRKKPVPLTVGNVARIGDAMMGQPYGWGGLFGQRDCSAMMRDLFTPFGIWLPRNSRPQGQSGTRMALEGLPPDQKEVRIMAKGVPFFSLISMPGHVGLYLGSYPVPDGKQKGDKAENEVPVMFHIIWGLRTESGWGENKKSGRAVIGKAVVTTLRPGVEHKVISSQASILDRIVGLVVLPSK
jgi:predicted small lipoprotein YifL